MVKTPRILCRAKDCTWYLNDTHYVYHPYSDPGVWGVCSKPTIGVSASAKCTDYLKRRYA